MRTAPTSERRGLGRARGGRGLEPPGEHVCATEEAAADVLRLLVATV